MSRMRRRRFLLGSVATALGLGALGATPVAADPWYRAGLARVVAVPPYRTQFDDSPYARSDCGPAVLSMALAAYGVDRGLLELRQLTHTYQGTWPVVRIGTALQHVARVAEDLGLPTSGLYDPDGSFHSWSVDEVGAAIGAGRLVIPLVRFGLLPGHETTGVRWGHYILLFASDGEGFRYHDPAFRPIEEGPNRWISRDQLGDAMAPVFPSRQAVALG
jgi:Papain-like cysteine protease AvrRpt2